MCLPAGDWQSVVARLDVLEARNVALLRQNRRMKHFVAAAALLVGVLVCWSHIRPSHADDAKAKKVIEASEFRVKDEGGKTRAILGPGSFILHNVDGDARLAMFTNKKGGTAILLFTGNDQKQQINIMQTKEGLSTFGINDRNGKTRVMLATRPDGKPALLLQDEKQRAFFAQSQR
jgi:hypothetical protein